MNLPKENMKIRMNKIKIMKNIKKIGFILIQQMKEYHQKLQTIMIKKKVTIKKF